MDQLDSRLFNQYLGFLYRAWNDANFGIPSFANLVLAGSFSFSTTSVSSAYTVGQFDTVVFLDATNAFTVTLPTAVGSTGRILIFTVKTGTKVITITANGSETINGAASIFLPGQYETYRIVSDGSNWFIL